MFAAQLHIFVINLCKDFAFLQEDHSEAVQRELGIEIAKDDDEEEEEHPGEHKFLP